MENRFAELETQLAHQEEAIDQLNQVVYQQQKQIAALEAGAKHLMGRFHTLSEGLGDSPSDEPPPHY